jgi:hypothetical protein
VGNDEEGSHFDLIESKVQNLAGGAKEDHEKAQST